MTGNLVHAKGLPVTFNDLRWSLRIWFSRKYR